MMMTRRSLFGLLGGAGVAKQVPTDTRQVNTSCMTGESRILPVYDQRQFAEEMIKVLRENRAGIRQAVLAVVDGRTRHT